MSQPARSNGCMPQGSEFRVRIFHTSDTCMRNRTVPAATCQAPSLLWAAVHSLLAGPHFVPLSHFKGLCARATAPFMTSSIARGSPHAKKTNFAIPRVPLIPDRSPKPRGAPVLGGHLRLCQTTPNGEFFMG
ncbi:hypothetical protein NDU88_000203 [Pleurodeles waltl]|uniref:Uncharacterized protein n=1 Tax=Pleurodeles waltl TaxID=8319 RepID=A0AAV7TEF5_PLEWA|nr:hypothetical protein NDU88_000203 [Pleurodeles waltl]